MGQQELQEIATELAAGYPDRDKIRSAQEFQSVVATVLPFLAKRVPPALTKGVGNITEVWELIREDSERQFEKALAKVERVKVIFVASKFMNNKLIGEMMTKQALEIARHGKGY